MSWFNKKKKKPTSYDIILKYMELNTSLEKDPNEYTKILDDSFKYYNKNDTTGISTNKSIVLSNINSLFINMTELNADINEITITRIDKNTFKVIVTGYGQKVHQLFKYVIRSEVKIEEIISINETVDKTTIKRIDSYKESKFLCFVV
jgi:hypothetical protein